MGNINEEECEDIVSSMVENLIHGKYTKQGGLSMKDASTIHPELDTYTYCTCQIQALRCYRYYKKGEAKYEALRKEYNLYSWALGMITMLIMLAPIIYSLLTNH